MGGGAWKVAYADFVTAMMALFMVLWISAQDEEIVFKAVQYFRDPFGVGFSDDKRGSLNDNKGDNADEFTLKQQEETKTSMVDLVFLHKVAAQFYQRLNMDVENEEKKKPVKVKVMPDGLRITVFGQNEQFVFKPNTAEFTEWGEFIVKNLAWLLDRNDMSIRIDSHTPLGYETEDPDYSPWELNMDRSNAARKLLESLALKKNRVSQISGFAGSKPLENTPLESPQNQRLEISLLVE